MPIRTEGLDEHEDELEDNSERAKNITPFALKAIIVITTNFWPRRWRRQVDLAGRPWPRLLPETVRRKKSARILFDRGLMFASVQINQSSITKANPDGLVIGTNWKQAATHNFGDPDRGIPRRTWIGWDRKDLAFLAEGFLDYIMTGDTP